MSSQRIKEAVESLQQGGVIAYPTEAVYGLGCDPTNNAAIERLLSIKQRRWEKGLILIAADFKQLQPYLLEVDKSLQEKILSTWPTNHPLAVALCREFGAPLVSTSANLSGKSATRTAEEVHLQLGDKVDYVLEGEIGGSGRPSEIRDALTGKIVREA